MDYTNKPVETKKRKSKNTKESRPNPEVVKEIAAPENKNKTPLESELKAPSRQALERFAEEGYLNKDFISEHTEGLVFYTTNQKAQDLKNILEKNGYQAHIRKINQNEYSVYVPGNYGKLEGTDWFLWAREQSIEREGNSTDIKEKQVELEKHISTDGRTEPQTESPKDKQEKEKHVTNPAKHLKMSIQSFLTGKIDADTLESELLKARRKHEKITSGHHEIYNQNKKAV